MSKVYAYHATPIINKSSIEKSGLMLNQIPINKGNNYYVEDQLFFTFASANEAKSIVKEMLKDEGVVSDVIVYRVPIEAFDVRDVGYDYNVKCECQEDVKNFTYCRRIPYEQMEVVPSNEMGIGYTMGELLWSSNEKARDIGEKLLDIWEEKIAWLYEDEYCE